MAGSANPHVKQITDDNFEPEVLQSPIPFLLDLTAEWCGPCKALAPVIDALAAEYQGKAAFGTADVGKNPQIPAQFKVTAVPTLLMFSAGKVVGQLTGAHPRGRIVDLIEKALPSN